MEASDEAGNPAQTGIISISLDEKERFMAAEHKPLQHPASWNCPADVGHIPKAENPTPFIISSGGWGIFNNTTVKNYFDIGRFQKEKLYIYNSEGAPDFYLFLGKEMSDVIDLYTQVTGRPYLLPKWAYGLAFGGNQMENQFDIMKDALRFREEQIPCDIFWLEPQWMEKRSDFSTSNWNFDRFLPNPSGRRRCFRNMNTPASSYHGYTVLDSNWPSGSVSITTCRLPKRTGWQGNGSSLSGKEHWFDHLTRFIDQGVDGFKLDPAHTLDEHPELKYYNGKTDKEMHNLNQVLLPKHMYETFRSHKGIRSFHHYCGGYAGTQHWGAATSGDNGGGKVALLDQLNLGLSGFLNSSADVLVDVSDNKMAMHMGFFLPWIQVNSWYNLLHPWYMKPEEKELFRFYARLRNSLFPYIYSAALQGSQTGIPIARAMPLVFPDDRAVDNIINQYMFGEHLLVAIYSDSLYLPKGNWINYWTGEKVAGNRIVKANVPETRGGPLFIREGAIIPYQKPSQFIGEHPLDTIELRIYPHQTSSYTLWEDDGITFAYEEGKLSKTKIDCRESGKETTITLNAVVGSYDGMPLQRTWELRVFTGSRPTQLLLNNITTDKWVYENGTVHFTLFQDDFHKKQTIVIQ